jgi:hypothetical protein
MGDGHGGIDKVASSWTLHGWSPPRTRVAITLRGLKSPSTWMYDSTTYRNHAKNLCVPIAFAFSKPFLYLQSPPLDILSILQVVSELWSL